MERERAMAEQLLQVKEELLQVKEELLQAKAHVTALRRARARERIELRALEPKDIVRKIRKAEVPVLESKLQSAAAASPPAPAPDCNSCSFPGSSLGRYAADNKHVVSALPVFTLPLPSSLTPAPPPPLPPPPSSPLPPPSLLPTPSPAVLQGLHLRQCSPSRRRYLPS
jgi:hypothetical protein